MTPDEITWLTWGAIRHRPHNAPRWQEEGTRAAIVAKCATWDLATATGHVLAHARDPKAMTPAAIRGRFTPDNEPPIGGPPRPPMRDQECKTHAGHHAHNCSGCAADELAGILDNVAESVGQALDARANGRAAFEAARAQLRGTA